MSRIFAASRFGIVAIVLLAPSFAFAESPDVLADKVHVIFRTHCAKCHDGGKKARADLNVLNPSSLVSDKYPIVKPRKPDESELLQLVECGTMPPGTLPKVPEKDREVIREWIVAGAAAFPQEHTEQYALTKILNDVRSAKERGDNVADLRYITLNHLLRDEATTINLPLYRTALNKALNQLSTGQNLDEIIPIDSPTNSIYRLKLSYLGWDVKPFGDPNAPAPANGLDPSKVNLYDLLLLEYPHASALEPSDVVDAIVSEYLAKLNMVRPIPYLRGDWLVSRATQAPLYNDMLRLPLTLEDLEKRVQPGGKWSQQEASTYSAVLTGKPRVVERRWVGDKAYWLMHDSEVDAAADHRPSTAIFRLPNGLPGYFIADARNIRLDELPTDILRDALRKDGIRNGLSCMVCHKNGLEKGMNEWKATKAGRLEELMPMFEKDSKDYKANLQKTLLNLPEIEPLGEVWKLYGRDMARVREQATIKLVTLEREPRRPPSWYASLALADRNAALHLLADKDMRASPFLPINAITEPNIVGNQAKDAGVSFQVKTVKVVDNKEVETTSFKAGDSFRIVITNTGNKPLYFELITTISDKGKVSHEQQEVKVGKLDADGKYPFPARGKRIVLPPLKPDELTKYPIIVYAATEQFEPGVLLNQGEKTLPDGHGVAPRVAHPLYKIDGKKIVPLFVPAKMEKRTIEYVQEK